MSDGTVFVVGEALIDLVGDPTGRYWPAPGGSPANVAVGLARLDTPTELLARLGRGTFGQLIRTHLIANRVGLDHAIDADELSTLAVVSLDDDGKAVYDFYADGTADWQWSPDELPDPFPPDTVALCAGSIALARQPGAPALLQMLRREQGRKNLTIVLDPNIRADLLGDPDEIREYWDGLIELADVVKVSDEDLAWLVPQIDVVQIAKGWAECGPALIVVTRGEAGAFAATSEGTTVSVPAVDIEVTDTIGAGDTFTAGLVDSLRRAGLLGASARAELAGISAGQLRGILERAARAAALTCQRQGADPPTTAELDGAG